jgi:hypothetical protein
MDMNMQHRHGSYTWSMDINIAMGIDMGIDKDVDIYMDNKLDKDMAIQYTIIGPAHGVDFIRQIFVQ